MKLLLCLSVSLVLFANDTIIHAGRLIDVQTRQVKTKASIVIHDGRVLRIEDGFAAPPGLDVIDLADYTVLPGLIDCHKHISMRPGSPNRFEDLVTQTVADETVAAVLNARAILDAGFTSFRNVGSRGDVDLAIKRAIEKGLIPGPRMWVSGAPLSPTGGHGDPSNGLAPGITDADWGDSIVNGPADARRVVREHRKRGDNVIKLMPSGGVGSVGDDPTLQLMANDEMASAIETAHALGMRVCAHAHGKQAIDNAARLGVDSIEHGTYADAESFALMKQHGTCFVPTVYVSRMLFEIAQAHPESLPPHIVKKIQEVGPVTAGMFRLALKSGVKIAFGTDTGAAFRTGGAAKELTEMVRLGMDPMDALVSATRTAAELIGDERNIGAIAPGFYADIVAVHGDPLTNIREMESVKFVMKGGIVYLKQF
ncbi:MAG TPA: amidohydrolase family protein [Bryobacteraceae bacterium]|nr:amidohydrolase family protein [Bryobacteraceae bacterium]